MTPSRRPADEAAPGRGPARAPAVRIGLIGDHDTAVTAHRAIPRALALAGRAEGRDVDAEWLATDGPAVSEPAALTGFDGLWATPSTPYASLEGALAAIRFAREAPRPFLGTCGGFQHALLELARHALGFEAAASAEIDPAAGDPLIAPLKCALVEARGRVRIVPGTRLAAILGTGDIEEEYHCRYGLARGWEARLARAGLRVSARDPDGEPRAVELEEHPFFVATLFQVERAALREELPPVVRAFAHAAFESARARSVAAGPGA